MSGERQRHGGDRMGNVRQHGNDPLEATLIAYPARRRRAFGLARVPKFGKVRRMFDSFDLKLLNAMQEDADRTAEQLAELIALSPSAIARRLRRLRDVGAIARTVAIPSQELAGKRLRALIRVQLHDHAPAAGLAELKTRLQFLDEVQLCLEVSGTDDMVLLVACRDMAEFNAFADAELAASPVVRRYETSFIKKEVKNRPMVRLDERDAQS